MRIEVEVGSFLDIALKILRRPLVCKPSTRLQKSEGCQILLATTSWKISPEFIQGTEGMTVDSSDGITIEILAGIVAPEVRIAIR